MISPLSSDIEHAAAKKKFHCKFVSRVLANQHRKRGQKKEKDGKSVIEQSLKKSKARLNAAYAIIFKEEIQQICGAAILILKQMRVKWRIHFLLINLHCCATDTWPHGWLETQFYQSLDPSIAVFPYLGSLPSRTFYLLRDCSSVIRTTIESEKEYLFRQEREANVPKYLKKN